MEPFEVDRYIPQLQGESNIEEWRTALLRALDLGVMSDYVLADDVRKKAYINIYVNIMILQSLSLVVYRLTNAGYDFSTDYDVLEKDPKENYDLIMDTFYLRVDYIEDLVPEFNSIKPGDFPTLRAYHARATYLKRPLDELGCPVPDSYTTWTVVSAFEEFDPDWHNLMYGRMPRPWKDLMDEIDGGGFAGGCRQRWLRQVWS
ncbi:hypothetical protein GE09DRAFT_1052368 [Coniochaeta sp. 2T2.1]|nr:hypothetical protein GE09DRAFT_1052368 [Coniochaeta sp. 2T2.1]